MTPWRGSAYHLHRPPSLKYSRARLAAHGKLIACGTQVLSTPRGTGYPLGVVPAKQVQRAPPGYPPATEQPVYEELRCRARHQVILRV
jgi:hypothetical protein